MLAIEEILCELNREDINDQGLPPGFRFHPTDEELITFYLASKVFNGTFCGVEIAEVDLNRCEPWELPEVAKMGEREWYFFSLRDRKYPTGLRTNRATGAGYWKATGKDREVYSGSSGALLGMKKTLVFYKGRAPRGEKTKWVMHEYRLDGDFSYRHAYKEEWVICRIFHKLTDKKSSQTYDQLLHMSSSPTPHQNPNPFLIPHQENDPLLFSSTITSFSPNSLTPTTNKNNPYGSFEEQPTIPKQCKTEANFSQFNPSHDANMRWGDKFHQNNSFLQNPSLLFGMDCGVVNANEMSTSSVSFNRDGFQMLVDTPIKAFSAESWPLDL